MRLSSPLLGLLLAACNGDDTAIGATNAGSVDAAGDARLSSEGGSSDSADASFASKAGFIGVVSYATDVATVFTSSVSAGFFDGPGYSFGKGCQREVVGNCQVLVCDYTDGGSDTPPTGPVDSAGTIAIGGTTPTFSLVYNASTMKYEVSPAVPNDTLIFAAGSTVTFAAAGGDVPAFNDSLVAPTPFSITSPDLTSGNFSIDTSKELGFTWTGSSAGKLAFNIRTTTLSSMTTISSSFVSCQFDATARMGTIPSALLQKLQKTDTATTAILGTDLSSTKEVPAGDHLVHLAVGSAATKTDGKSPYAAALVTIF